MHFQVKQSCQNCFVSLQKEISFKETNLLSLGTMSFLLVWTLFQLELDLPESKQEVIKVVT